MFVVEPTGAQAVVEWAEELAEQSPLGLAVPISCGATGGRGVQPDSAQIGPAAAKRRDVQWPNRFHNAGGRPHQEHGPGPLEPIPLPNRTSMSGLLDGKVVLINGGTQGVGGASARAAVREGAAGRGDRSPRRCRQAVRRRNRRTWWRRAVCADRYGRPATGQAVGDSHRRGVRPHRRPVNAAGITTRGTLLDTTPELFDTHIAVNLRGTVLRHAGGGGRHGRPRGAGQHRQHHLDRRTRRPGVPRAVRGGQGRAGRPHPQLRLRASMGPHPDQRPQHRLDRNRGRGRRPNEASTRPTTTGPAAGSGCRWANSARPDEIAEFVVLLLSAA